MTIVGNRIDGRLIHGQVANLWTTKLNISRIMVVDDEVAENILAGKYDSQRLLIVARKPDRFLKLVEAGVPIETLNVGNMSQTSETRSVTRSINVVDEDVAVFNKLHDKGVVLTAQMVPNDPAEDFMKLLK